MQTIDEYLENVTPSQKAELERIRQLVKSLAPEAEEVISYNMPTFKYKGKSIIHFAAFKNHMSLFGSVNQFQDQLPNHEFSERGTLQFTEDNPVPDDIIKTLIYQKISEIDASS